MALTFGTVLDSEGLDPAGAIAIRHAYVKEHEDSGLAGIHVGSTDSEILTYTATQSVSTALFPAHPPRLWVVFIKEGGSGARFWRVVENRGEISNDGVLRVFDLVVTDHLTELRGRLVIAWKPTRRWWMGAAAAARYSLVEIADAEPIPFPGFDGLVLMYPVMQAVMRESRYASWRTALASVAGVYLITDTSDGRQYVGKADGAERISQRWSAYSRTGHGGNVELEKLDPSAFRFSILRVFDPSTPTSVVDAAEVHFKTALDSRSHGLNRN